MERARDSRTLAFAAVPQFLFLLPGLCFLLGNRTAFSALRQRLLAAEFARDTVTAGSRNEMSSPGSPVR